MVARNIRAGFAADNDAAIHDVVAGLTRVVLHVHSVGLWVPRYTLTEALALRLQEARAFRRTPRKPRRDKPRREQEWVPGWPFVAHHCGPRRLAQLQAILDDFPAVKLSRADMTADLHFADYHGRRAAIRFFRRHLFIRRGATKLVQRIHWVERGERNGNWSSCDYKDDGPRADLQKPKTRRTAEGYQDPVDEHGNLIGENVLRLEQSISRQAAKAWPFSEVPLDRIMTLDPTTVLDRLYVLKFIDPAKAPNAFQPRSRRCMRPGAVRGMVGFLSNTLEFRSHRVMRYTMNRPFVLPITPSWADFGDEIGAC